MVGRDQVEWIPLERSVLDQAPPELLGQASGLDGWDVICLPLFEEDRPLQDLGAWLDWRWSGALTRLLRVRDFGGGLGERVLSPCPPEGPGRRLLLYGLGSSVAGGLGGEGGRDLGRTLRSLMSPAVKGPVLLAPPRLGAAVGPDWADALLSAFVGESAPRLSLCAPADRLAALQEALGGPARATSREQPGGG